MHKLLDVSTEMEKEQCPWLPKSGAPVNNKCER